MKKYIIWALGTLFLCACDNGEKSPLQKQFGSENVIIFSESKDTLPEGTLLRKEGIWNIKIDGHSYKDVVIREGLGLRHHFQHNVDCRKCLEKFD